MLTIYFPTDWKTSSNEELLASAIFSLLVCVGWKNFGGRGVLLPSGRRMRGSFAGGGPGSDVLHALLAS